MINNQLQQLITLGVSALKAASRIAAQETDEIQNDAHNPELKAALAQDIAMAKIWLVRIDRALGEVGGTTDQPNHIMQAHYEVSRRIRSQGSDNFMRDLGIIASAQRVLHYWIASFSTVGTYAMQAGMSQLEQAMQASLDEARQADEDHTRLAKRIMDSAR